LLALGWAALVLCGCAVAAWSMSSARAAEAVRAEVGKPLQAAEELIKARKYREALARIHDADAVSNKTPYESYLLERVRGYAAAQAGDNETALKSFEAVMASGRLSAPEQLSMLASAAGLYYRAKDYPKAASTAARYFAAGGTDPGVRTVLIQSYYLENDCPAAIRELQKQTQSVEEAGRAPPEEQLRLLLSCELKQKDYAGFAQVLEKLVAFYPKREYWIDLIHRVERKPGFSDRLTLDVYRLKIATGSMGAASDYMEMAQLALQAGLSTEAKKVLDRGFAAGVLGKGPEAEREQRLRELAANSVAEDAKTIAKSEADASAAPDGTALVDVGFAYVDMGQLDKGIALIERGLRQKGFKHPEEAKLHAGIAYFLAGEKAKAAQIWRSVQGNTGEADLARLWLIQVRGSA